MMNEAALRMTPAINRILRSRWLAGGIHASLWLLLYLALTHLGGKAFNFHEADSSASLPQNPVPVAALPPATAATPLSVNRPRDSRR